jgi:hypothetical protein
MCSAGRAIGLEVHLEFCEVAVCASGEVRSAGRVDSRPEALEALAASLLATDRVALEVMGAWWEIVRILEPHVAKVIVVCPGDTGIAHAPAKTDRLDARTLARLLWMGDLDGVWTPDEHTRVLRRAVVAWWAAGALAVDARHLLTVPAVRLPRAGSEGPPVRVRAREARAALKARIATDPLGAGRSDPQRDPAARFVARVPSAAPRTATRSRPSPRRASSLACSAACSHETRTTPTPSRH